MFPDILLLWVNDMKFYLAPMEGITGYVYRNAHETFFHTVDRYMSPFIAPNQNRCMNTRETRDVLPEHNQGMDLVPQIMTNKAHDFVATCEKLSELGYSEVNLNLGCPSGTVVSKRRGSGFLVDPEELDRFFDQIFQNVSVDVSVKTRLGLESVSEFDAIMNIYNKYPLKELVIHPRVQKEFYQGSPHWDVFREALSSSRAKVCYNGDIFTVDQYKQFVEEFPQVDRIMVGRGVLVNPGLIGQIKGEKSPDKETIRKFHDRLMADYGEIMSGDRNLLFKMKEIWFYLCHSFTNYEKYYKKIRKAEKLSVYEAAVNGLFAEQEVTDSPIK